MKSILLAIFTSFFLLCGLVGCSTNDTLESSNYYAHDDAITARVKSTLLQDPTLHLYRINVETTDRVVTLSGYVNNRATVDRANAIVTNVRGVRAVENNLAVDR